MAAPKHSVETVDAQDIARPAFDLLTPLSSRVLFWQPRFVLGSDALHSLPYLFWLVETLRPARMVQIGIGDGVSYLGLCQAVDKLSLDTMCLGLDWPARDKPAPGGFPDHHASHYADFSRVLAEDPATAFRHLRSGGIDLLVVQAPLDANLAETLRAHWQPLLSERAVLVFPGADLNSHDPDVQKFMASFLTRCPVVELEIEGGTTLTVLLGADQPERLTRLAALEMGRPGYAEARQVFARLGTGLRQEQLAKFRTLELKKVKATLGETETQIAERDKAISSATAEAKAALEAESDSAALVAGLQARIFDLETRLQDQADTYANTLETALATQATAQQERLETALAEAAAALQASEEKRKTHWRNLTSQAEARSKAEARVAELTQESARLATALEVKTAEAETALQEADAKARTAMEDAVRAAVEAAETKAEAEAAQWAEHLQHAEMNAAARVADIATLTAHLETARADAARAAEQAAAAAETHLHAQIESLNSHHAETLATALAKALAEAHEAAEAQSEALARSHAAALDTAITKARAEQDTLIADIAALTGHFETERAKAAAILMAEQARLAALTTQAQTLESELEAFQSAHKAALSDAATEREQHLATQGQLTQLRADLAARDGALRRMQDRLDVAQDKRTRHWHKLEAETLRTAELEALLKAETTRATALKANLAEAEERIAALEGSTSWKVTSPLRKIRNIGPKP